MAKKIIIENQNKILRFVAVSIDKILTLIFLEK